MKTINKLNFVIFDGSSHYVVDSKEKEELTTKDKTIEVIFKSLDLEKCQDLADELNEEI